ncbi:MAG: SDR family oxidoreductase [Bacteroidales bacterium]
MKNFSLVTGASNGIGLDLARLLAKDKHNLILIARSAEKLNGAKASIEKDFGVKVKIIVADLSLPDAASKLFDEIRKENIHVDILINNAGFGDYGPFVECNWQKQENMINLNILTLTKLTRLFLPAMISVKYGRILNLASVASFMPGPLMSVYYASKAFVLSFSYAIANEVKGTGVTVTALCPGPTDTGFMAAASLKESKLFKTFKPKSSLDVALYGYQRMLKGKTLAIPGTLNKLLVTIIRFSSGKLTSSVVKKIQGRIHH